MASSHWATRRAYRSDFGEFSAWCDAQGLAGLPAAPETIAAFLAAEAVRGVKAATIGRRVAAIRHAHKLAGHEPPTNSEVVKATVRASGARSAPPRSARLPSSLRWLVRWPRPPRRAQGLARPRAAAAGLRRRVSALELVALDVSDIEEAEAVLGVDPPIQDRPGGHGGDDRGHPRGSAALPGEGARAWLEAAGIAEGAIFRPVAKGGRVRSTRLRDKAVASVVKAYAERLGLDAADFSGHSLRSGFLTSAARRGASVFKMRDVAGTSPWTCCRATCATPSYSVTMPEPDCFNERAFFAPRSEVAGAQAFFGSLSPCGARRFCGHGIYFFQICPFGSIWRASIRVYLAREQKPRRMRPEACLSASARPRPR